MICYNASMPAIAVLQKIKLLSVRLPEPEIRRLKTIAAHRGMSVQEAVQRAVETWVLSTQSSGNMEPLSALRGSLAGSADVDTLRRREREAELAKDNRWS
jgi:hypothetical protein